jgi:hypothetical protein
MSVTPFAIRPEDAQGMYYIAMRNAQTGERAEVTRFGTSKKDAAQKAMDYQAWRRNQDVRDWYVWKRYM